MSDTQVALPNDRCSDRGTPELVTGTPTCVATSHLMGERYHTFSSHAESLYYAVRRAILGHVPGESAMVESRDSQRWLRSRRGAMMAEQRWPAEYQEIGHFLQDLHRLFWPVMEGSGTGPSTWYAYRSNVSLDEVIQVCRKHHSELLPPVNAANSTAMPVEPAPME